MIIYSHNLHEKLFGYAISREFIKYQSPFCDLLDDPTLALDFDLAINFNQALNGNALARVNFTNTLILCSTDLDVTTLEFYKSKMEAYPVFFPEITRINYTFANLNRLPSDNGGFIDKLKNAVKDCLNSPCNLFTQSSDTIGKLAQGTLYATEGTTLPVGELKDVMSTFTGGIASTIFNKIPEIFQISIVNLKQIGKNAWSESLTMLVEDDLPTLVAKAQNGESLRTNTAGYRYTPDLKSYLDLSEVASDILGNVAADLGDCFRRYQQAVRYNPYDPKQNQSSVSKGPITDQENGTTFYRNGLGQPVEGNNGGDQQANLSSSGIGNKQPKEPSKDSLVTQVYDFRSPGRGGDGELTVYTALLENNRFTTDTTTDSNTQVGNSAFPKNVPFIPPNSYNAYKRLINEGKTNNTNLSKLDKGKMNNGFAMNLDSLARLLGNNFTKKAIRDIMNGNQSDKWIYAEITPSVGTKQIVQLIDTNTAEGSKTAIDLTLYAWNQTFTQAVIPTKKQLQQGPIELSDDGAAIEVYAYSSAPDVSAKVRFIVGKVSDVGTASGSCGEDSQEEMNNFVAVVKTTVNDWKSYTSNQIPIPSFITDTVKLIESNASNYSKETDPNTKLCIYVNSGRGVALVYRAIGEEYAKLSQFGEGTAEQKATLKQTSKSFISAGVDIDRQIDNCPKSSQCPDG
jgi:hypothetical protein